MEIKLGELAFEHGDIGNASVVYRVESVAEWNGRKVSCVHWFSEQGEAVKYVDREAQKGNATITASFRRNRTELGERLAKTMPRQNYIADDPVYPQEIRIAGRRIYLRSERGATFLDVENCD